MDVAYGHPFHLTRTQTAPLHATTTSKPDARNFSNTSSFSDRAKSANMHSVNTNITSHPAPSLVHSQGHTSSNYSIQSQPSSRSSDTTQGTAHSTLFPPPPPLPSNAGAMAATNGDLVTATDNVMNSVADASSSLFQICVSLRQRLHGVQGFGESLLEEEEEADDDTDPVTLLWRTFRRGYPLMLLYNALRPNQPLSLPAGVREDKRGKAATFKFLQACITDLKFPQEEMFIITDLYGDDTTGFSKVVKVVSRVLDILVSRGLVEDIRPTASDFEQAEKGMKRTQRQHIISELVTTERTYVQHLELLQSFKHLVEEKGVIPGDAVHDIFLNLNSLLDFQRRFLIRVEQTNGLPEDQQNWGKLFVLYCEAFKVYEPYIANQKKCERIVVANFPSLSSGIMAQSSGASNEMRQMVESPTALYGFLMKPFQRLSKYPLLLDDLYKKGDLDEGRRDDLIVGKEASTSVLARTNKAVDREEKAEAVQELKMRVEDWKGHRVEGFGELLLYGTFTVLKSENIASGKEAERQYHVYLFETILLCCKDIDLSKPKNKLSNRTLVDKRGKPKLQLKGRIFMQNVTDLISLAKPGSYTCQIFWKGDPSIENFIIRFASEEMMKKWAQQIEAQRRRYRDHGSRVGPGGGGSARDSGASRGGTSVTEFEFMRNQTGLENPYAEFGEDEEDGDDVDTLVASSQGTGAGAYYPTHPHPYQKGGDFGASSRNGSSTSLRSRSTTGESTGMAPLSAASGRAPAPRFPQGSMSMVQGQQPNLSLRTREATASPANGFPPNDGSYFSPLENSPSQSVSSRSSAQSVGMYPFPRQNMGVQLPQNVVANGYYEEGHGHGGTRFTAPAIARQREPSSGSTNGPAGPVVNGGTYPPTSGRGTPVGPRPGMHSAVQMPGQPRNRSASSPDIHNNPTGRGQPVQQQQRVPEMPTMPAPYNQQNVNVNVPQHMIPRSQSNSPQLGMQMPGGPVRQQSPQMQRGYGRQGQDPSPTSYVANGYAGGPPQMQMRAQGQYGPSGPGSRTTTPVPRSDAFSPAPLPLPASLHQQTSAPANMSTGDAAPTQLKVKVHCPSASQTLTLVVPMNISYQSLKDRIDAKLQRSTTLSLGDRGPKEAQVKLKYLDEEDFVSIQSDEDVQTAFETWREQQGDGIDLDGPGGGAGQMGEIELFCQR